MVYEKVKKLLVIFFFMTIIILSVFALKTKTEYETNLAKTILPDEIVETNEILSVTNKFSSVIKVVFESKNENPSDIKNEFLKNLDTTYFEIITPDFTKLLNKYLEAPTNFLSEDTRKQLKQKKYDDIKQKALETLYNPIGLQLTEFDKDPYMLLSDFLMNLDNKSLNNNTYDYCILKIKNEKGLSPDITNKEIKKLIKLQKKYSNEKQKIYLAGSPIHSYYTSTNSTLYINIICILATFLIIFLTYKYFRNIKMLIPIAMSIILGFWVGYIITKLCFGTFHIITFVYATTLIGIGIDYSYHYLFSRKKDISLIKNLTFSMLTTTSAFILLFLSGIELLKQISIFTISGLITIYLFVIIIYPHINFPESKQIIDLEIKKSYKIIAGFIVFFSVLGLMKIAFDDSLSAFYTPSTSLLNAEKLFNQVSGQDTKDTTILTITGNNIQSVLEREENVSETLSNNNIKFSSLSKFIPSIKRQNENILLVQELYKNNLESYKDILSDKQINNLKKTLYKPINFKIDDYPYLKDFLINKNTSVMFVYSNDDIPQITNDNIQIITFNKIISNYLRTYRITLLKTLPIVFLLVFIILCCPNKNSRKAEGVSEFMRVATLKGEPYDGSDEEAAEGDTRLNLIYRAKKASIMIIPQLLACISAIGLTSLTGQQLNLFSIISLFLIIGFTIDYSIFRVKGDESSETAVFISCITTSFSFLMLSFTGFKLISSISSIIFIGIISAYLIGLILFKNNKI